MSIAAAPVLTTNQAAKAFDLSAPMILKHVADGRIRSLGQRPLRRGTTATLFDREQFLEDLDALPRCILAICNTPSLRDDGFCQTHAAERVTLTRAAKDRDLDPLQLREAAQRGDVRCIDPTRSRILFLEHELDENLPRCILPSCHEQTLREDGFCGSHAAERVTVALAAHGRGLDVKALMRAVRTGQIRCVDPSRRRILLDERELDEDLDDLPLCRAPGCDARVIVGSGWCRGHRSAAGRVVIARNRATTFTTERDWLTTSEVARLAGVSTAKVYQDAKRGELPSERTTTHLRIPRAATRAYIAARAGRPPPTTRPTTAERAERKARANRLHEAGLRVDEIARELGVARNTAAGYLDELGLDRPRRRSARKLSPDDRRRQGETVRLLASEGASVAAIAEHLGIGTTQVGLLLRDRDGREDGPARCEMCGEPIDRRPYAPRDPGFGRRRFCSGECKGAMARGAYQIALHERGLIGVPEAAEHLGVSIGHVHVWLATGLLIGERVNYAGQIRPGWGVRREELRRFEGEWARGPGSSHGTRRLWLDPDRAVQQLGKMGHLEVKARKLSIPLSAVRAMERDRVAARAQRLSRRRAGRKSRPTPAHHQEWFERFLAIERELNEEWQRDRDLDLAAEGRPPSRWEICRAVAQEDWQRSPERWPRDLWPAAHGDAGALDPRSAPAATEKVSKALKRLQIRQTEMPVD